jgi:NAD(P)H-flavin reductase
VTARGVPAQVDAQVDPRVDSAAAPVRPRPPDPMLPRPFTVTRTHRDTHDTATLELEPADGEPFAFAPGQFTMVGAFGGGEVPISISGDPARPGLLRHTVRDVGSATHAIVSAAPGAVLCVRGPLGTGWDVASAAGGDVVFVAGGIGLAPLRPAILEVCARRDDFRQVSVLYGCRTPGDLLFGEDLATWGRESGVAVEVTVDRSEGDWQGRVGLVTNLIARAGFAADRTTAFICGPEVMMRYSAIAFVEQGVPEPALRLSMERNMKCGIGLCGHCQLRELFLCVDGPVVTYDRLRPLMSRAEL